MYTINENLFIGFIIIVFIVGIIIFYMIDNHSLYNKSWVNSTMSLLTGLSILIILVFYIANLQSLNQGDDIELKKEVFKISEMIYVTIPEELKYIYEECPDFVHSLVDTNKNKDFEYKFHIKEHHLSHIIFSIWMRIILYSDYIEMEEIDAYLELFMLWSSSPYLLKYWSKNKKYFNNDTKLFGEAIFKKDKKEIRRILNL
jgi:hypothetical protein